MKQKICQSRTILRILEPREAVEGFLNTAWSLVLPDKWKAMKVEMQIQEKTALTVFAELHILKWLQRGDTLNCFFQQVLTVVEKYNC